MGGKTLPGHAGNNCRKPAMAARRQPPASISSKTIYLVISKACQTRRAWHATGNEVTVRPLGEQEMKRTLKPALVALAVVGVRRFDGDGDVAHQGPRQYRGHPAEPADRLWPGRRPQRHRRYAQQHAVHQAIAARHAGAARRQHPRPADSHRQRGRRDGHRQPAAVRHARHPHRRHRLGHGRRQEPARRHASGDAAARRRRQRLCGGPGLARHRRLPGRGRSGQDHPRRADGRPAAERRHHRARDRILAGDARPVAAGAAQSPTSPPPSASPSRSTTISARRSPSRSIPRPCS